MRYTNTRCHPSTFVARLSQVAHLAPSGHLHCVIAFPTRTRQIMRCTSYQCSAEMALVFTCTTFASRPRWPSKRSEGVMRQLIDVWRSCFAGRRPRRRCLICLTSLAGHHSERAYDDAPSTSALLTPNRTSNTRTPQPRPWAETTRTRGCSRAPKRLARVCPQLDSACSPMLDVSPHKTTD